MDLVSKFISLIYSCSLTPNPSDESSFNELIDIINNYDNIPIILEVASTHNDKRIRKTCLVYLRRIFKNINSSKRIDIIMFYLPSIFNLYNSEKSKNNIDQITNLLEIICSQVVEESDPIEFQEIGEDLISKKSSLRSGLYYYSLIYECFSTEKQEELLVPLGDLCIELLSSSNKKIRMNAVSLLETILFAIEDPEMIEKLPNLPEAVKNLVSNSINIYQDESECALVFSVLEFLLFDRFDFFSDLRIYFLEYVCSIANSCTIPLQIRVLSQQILDSASSFCIDYYMEHYCEYIESSLMLSLECINKSRNESLFRFPSTFLCSLSMILDPYDSYCKYIELVHELIVSDDLERQQIALFFLSCVVEGCSDAIVDDPSFLLDLIINGLQVDNFDVVSEANELLSSVILHSPSILSLCHESLVNLLVARASDVRFLVTLEALLFAIDRPLSNVNELIDFLVQFLEKECDFQDNVIRCISGAVSHYSGVNEDFYTVVGPYIEPLIGESGTLSAAAFECIGYMCSVCPQSVHDRIDLLIPSIINVLSSQDVSSCRNVAGALKQLLKVFPGSIEHWVDDMVDLLLSILDLPIPNRQIELDEDNEPTEEERDALDATERAFFEMRSAAIVSLSIIVELMSERIKGKLSVIYKKMYKMLKSGYLLDEMSAAVAIKHSIPVLYSYELDPQHLLEGLVKLITNQAMSVQGSIQLFRLLSHLLSSLDPVFTHNNSDVVGELLVSCIHEDLEIIKENGGLKSIETTLAPTIFECIHRFILLMGDQFDFLKTTFTEPLVELINGRSKTISGFAIRILSTISNTLLDFGLYSECFEPAFLGINSNHVGFRASCINALCFLSRTNKDHFRSYSLQVIDMIHPLISQKEQSLIVYESALALWSTIHIVYRENVSSDKIINAFSPLVIRGNKSSDHIVAWARMVTYAVTQLGFGDLNTIHKLAVIVLSSSDFELSRIGQEPLELFKQSLLDSESPEEKISSLIMFNQRKTKIIISRINT